MSTLSDLIKQDRFASPAHEALLSVMVTQPFIMGRLADVMSEHDLTPAQYNVLRILRGCHPERATCSYIGERLMDRTPDVTRLLNRLGTAGFVDRRRADHDRRVVEVWITDEGLERLARLDHPVDAMMHELASGLTDDEHRMLSHLLEKVRQAAEVPA
ncbi:MAG: MarR family transcriptional regulator [Bacteroidota bacterium]